MTFKEAASFNYKEDLDLTWESMNPELFPGLNMFQGTCSEDEACGTCGNADALPDVRRVECGSEQGGKMAEDVLCRDCRDYGNECCRAFKPTDANLQDAVDDWLASEALAERRYGPISDWDVSSITTMSHLFDTRRNPNASHFNADLSRWNVGQVTDMRSLFRGCAAFESDLSGWDLSKVRRLDFAFAETFFNSDISSWQTPALVNLTMAFAENAAFNQNLSSWNVSRVELFHDAFFKASSFNFANALHASWGEHVGNQELFRETCSEDVTCGTCRRRDTLGSSVSCGSSQVARDENTECTHCADYGFECCKPFEFDNTNIHEGVSEWLEDSVAATTKYGPIADWDVSRVTSTYELFCNHVKDCGGRRKGIASTFNDDLSKWDVSAVTNFNEMFLRAYQYAGDISKWDVSKSTTMIRTFESALAFNGDLSTWNVGKVTSMHAMFLRASLFNSDLSKWDVSKVTSVKFLFRDAHEFNSDVSKWDVANVNTMFDAFFRAYEFNSDVSKWESQGSQT